MAETAVAQLIIDYTRDQNLSDAWAGRNGFTWRRKKKMSKLDRIFYRLDDYDLVSTTTNWSFTDSDHAAVITTLQHVSRPRRRNQHVKLDNSVVNDSNSLNELKEYLTEQLVSAHGMTPQVKLEFAKMTIRTKALEIMARNRVRLEGRLDVIENEIQNYTRLLARHADADSQEVIVTELEVLNTERNNLLTEQGR
jgi:hypothetical protein